MKNAPYSFAILLSVALFLIAGTTQGWSQNLVNSRFGQGLSVMAKDSSFLINAGFRFQNLFVYEVPAGEGGLDFSESHTSWLVRRSRLKFDGFAYSPRLKYKLEIGMTNSDIAGASRYSRNAPFLILDAVAQWNFAGNFVLWAGQTKLPGNRERVISSADLQFVERSMLNSLYNIDRDMGFQLRHHFKIGKVIIREIAAVSQGEGRNVTAGNIGGFGYTGRVEVLPFGSFAGKGDYVSSDLAREQQPKLSVAASYDYNDHAPRTGGQLGEYVLEPRVIISEDELRSLSTVFIDMMFKYRGISVMAEYVNKQSDKSPLVADTAGNSISYLTGTGLNIQAGYLFKNNWEVAGRYTTTNTDEITEKADHQQYTLGVSRYIVGHKLKVQTDVIYTTEKEFDSPDFVEDGIMVRLQLEVHL
ncbi:MAG: porin [Bacteroidia bacterium]